jgi:3-mercaptopyruvate sulfurtransferase SseA
MNMILKLGGMLIAGMAIAAADCPKSGAAMASDMPANSAAPIHSLPQNAEDKMPRVTAEEAKKLVAEGKAIIIDVRGSDSYKSSHIKGALDFPLKKLEAGDFTNLPKDKRIIAYCT